VGFSLIQQSNDLYYKDQYHKEGFLPAVAA
jgi:hypothetical protein